MGRVEGILIDGYIPKFSFLKEIDSQHLKAYLELVPCDHRYVYRKYLRSDLEVPGEHLQHRIFEHLVKGVRTSFCPVRGKGRVPSAYKFYPSKGYHRIERIMLANKRGIGKYLNSLLEELGHDMQKDDYGLNLIMYDRASDNYCGLQDECSENWISELGFRVKPKENYENYQRFEEAAQELLDSEIKKAIKNKLLL